MTIDWIEFKEEKKNDMIIYSWEWKWLWAVVLWREWSWFYTTALVTKKEWWQLEQISHMWTTLSECKQILKKMYNIALWYNIQWPWKEY